MQVKKDALAPQEAASPQAQAFFATADQRLADMDRVRLVSCFARACLPEGSFLHATGFALGVNGPQKAGKEFITQGRVCAGWQRHSSQPGSWQTHIRRAPFR